MAEAWNATMLPFPEGALCPLAAERCRSVLILHCWAEQQLAVPPQQLTAQNL